MTMRVHISLAVNNLDESLEFYQKMFGQPPTKVRKDYANFRLDQPAIHLALEPSDSLKHDAAGETTHSHFGIELPDLETFGAWRERLRETGAQGRDEEGAVCCYAKAEKVWLTDPDQNPWEIWVRTGEAEQMHSNTNECCVAA